jgi:hypothetical protein
MMGCYAKTRCGGACNSLKYQQCSETIWPDETTLDLLIEVRILAPQPLRTR